MSHRSPTSWAVTPNHPGAAIRTHQTELKPVFHDPEKAADRQAALAVLASHLPILTAPGLVFGISAPARSAGDGVTEMGYFSLGPEAAAFMADVYAYGWVRDFDWMSWSHTLEGRCLLHDPTALEAANEEGLARVLTVCMRQAHWGSEDLDDRFREGLLTRLMERAATLCRSCN
ncbi:DUF6508 domain-containing protein [Methylobacterium sp. Leaf456]|uniref:DUF6508 domain-containing protein n=1 Tax=Methylobacterium sp. Leaf456 TaxID=1736382 RepID=UPI00257106BE|nr:DUF6508 domain-containing protein [Methylobacterium sp. Leaf456]